MLKQNNMQFVNWKTSSNEAANLQSNQSAKFLEETTNQQNSRPLIWQTNRSLAF